MSRELLQAATRSPVRKFSLEALRTFGEKAKNLHSLAAEVGEAVCEAASHSPPRPKFTKANSDGALKIRSPEHENVLMRRKTEGDLNPPPKTPKTPSNEGGFWDGVNVGRSDSVTPSHSPSSPSSPSKTPTRRYSKENLKPARKKLDFGKSKLDIVEEANSDLGLTPLKAEATLPPKTPLTVVKEALFPKMPHNGYPDPGSSMGRLFGHKVMHPDKYGGIMKIQKTQMSTLAYNAPQYLIEAHVVPGETGLVKLLRGFEKSVINIERACTNLKVDAYMKAHDAAFKVIKVQAWVKKWFGDPVNFQICANGSKDLLFQALSENAEAVFSLWKAVGMTGFGLITVVYANAPNPTLDKPLSGAVYQDYGNATIKFANPVPDDDGPKVPNPHDVVEVVACSAAAVASTKSKKGRESSDSDLDQMYVLAVLGFDYDYNDAYDSAEATTQEEVLVSGQGSALDDYPLPLTLAAI